MPTLAAGGKRYSIHDHLFDFSQPEVPCTECHDQGDERLARTPQHKWNIRPVETPRNMTTEEACLHCHADKTAAWVAEKIKSLKFRL